MGGLAGHAIHGAGIGLVQQLATPTINSMLPSFMGLSPATEAVLAAGVISKVVLKKGGSWADAAIIIGASQAAQQLASGMGGASAAGGMSYY